MGGQDNDDDGAGGGGDDGERDDCSLPADRTIFLRGDICTTGLWSTAGFLVFPDNLPVDPALRARLVAWADWYDDEDNKPYVPGGTPWEMLPEAPVAAFDAEGRALAHALKAALPPDWTVMYQDVAAWRRPPEEPLEGRRLWLRPSPTPR